MDRRRLWVGVQDGVLALVLAVMAFGELATASSSVLGEGSPVVAAAGVLATCAFITQRRLRPPLVLGVFLTWLVLGIATLGHLEAMFYGTLVPFTVALYSAARHGGPRLRWVAAGLAGVTILLADLAIPVLNGWNEVVFHWAVCVLAFGAGWGLQRSERRAVEEAVRAGRLESEARVLSLEAVAEERARIARELHDVLGHSVSVMVVQAGAAEQVLDDEPELVRSALASIRSTGTGALDEVRRVVTILREDREAGLAPQPGIAALGDLAESARAAGLDVDLEVTGDHAGISPGLGFTVYRIVQESLTNVRKHSGARRATVRVAAGAEELAVEVTDDGGTRRAVARAGAPGRGHGLIGMRERAALYGGTLEVGPSGEGFAVRAVLPRRAR